MKEFLDRFAKRMEFLAVADSIVGRINKNQEIERAFSPGELDNLLLSVLVFIMETTLTEEQECSIGAVSGFLGDILPTYQKRFNTEQCEELARYLVKDILQNKGEIRAVPVMDYESGMKSFSVRLVADKLDDKGQILYELTKQGFDFLFRTKEVDDELGFEIEAIRLRMLITKKNYKKAMSQSKYILAMLIEKRNEIRQFEQQLRHDLFSVSGEQYDTAVKGVDSMLREEYEIMLDIEKMLEQAQAHLDEERRSYAVPDEKSRIAQREIVSITANVQRALEMQRALIIRCDELRKLYISLLKEALLYSSVKRFDFEEQLLRRMERVSFSGVIAINQFRKRLLAPLFLPDIKRSLNLRLLYERQSKLRESQTDDGIEEDATDDGSEKLARIRLRNETHVRIISLLLQFAKEHGVFTFSEFWSSIKTNKHLARMTWERIIFLVMLKLYAIREIDIAGWHEHESVTMDSLGEFDLDYCLAHCYQNDSTMLRIKRITVEKGEGRAVCSINSNDNIAIDNLRFEVEYVEADREDTLQAFGGR
jgi:hypothetical protein